MSDCCEYSRSGNGHGRWVCDECGSDMGAQEAGETMSTPREHLVDRITPAIQGDYIREVAARALAFAAADALLADPRVAVVELPEPNPGAEMIMNRWVNEGVPNVYTNSGAVEWGARHATPEQARAFAAALLAAARKAEQ